MSTLDHNEPEGEKILASHGPPREEIDTSLGYEATDVKVTGIAVFLISLLIFIGEAVRDAFDSARRQLEDYVHVARGEVKTHLKAAPAE